MKFSIIIPAHNSEEYLGYALHSIREQTFRDYELIVICDACTDKTVELAKEYADIVKEVDFSCDGPARNAGLDLASGDWVLFMDDDDWFLHEFVLEQLDKKLNENQDIDILAFSFIFRGIKYATPKGNNGQYWIAVWSKCWRRSFIGKTRFPSLYMKSDVPFHRELMAKCPRILSWDMPMYYYNYLRIGSQTANHKAKLQKKS